jgi:hypothetical protein
MRVNQFLLRSGLSFLIIVTRGFQTIIQTFEKTKKESENIVFPFTISKPNQQQTYWKGQAYFRLIPPTDIK